MKRGDSSPEPSTHDHLLKGDRPGDVFVQRHFKLPTRLHRVLGVGGLFGAAYGDVGSSVYYALGIVSMSALGLTPPVLMISGIIFLFTALTYAEGATMLPEAGGSGAFAKRAFNDWVSFVASWVLMMDYIVTMSISAFSAANYLGFFLPILKTWPTNSIVGMGIVGGLALINSLGLRESSRLNIVLVVIDLGTQILVAILGAFLIINL
ncbi:MAG: APC family permease, partial [Dehalococcoidia bacterium]